MNFFEKQQKRDQKSEGGGMWNISMFLEFVGPRLRNAAHL